MAKPGENRFVEQSFVEVKQRSEPQVVQVTEPAPKKEPEPVKKKVEVAEPVRVEAPRQKYQQRVVSQGYQQVPRTAQRYGYSQPTYQYNQQQFIRNQPAFQASSQVVQGRSPVNAQPTQNVEFSSMVETAK